MKQAAVIQHVAFEGLGHIAEVLDARGYRVTSWQVPADEVWTIDPAHIDLLVVLGGPMSANDADRLPHIADTLQLARVALQRQIPYLGICLGAQLLAVAAGGSVVAMPAKEIALTPVRLTDAGARSPLRHLPAHQAVLHWHGEQIQLPPGAECLAQTDACAVQAFLLGTHALGLQFHIEADLAQLPQWLRGHADELARAGIDGVAMLPAAARERDALREVCIHVVRAWLDGLDAGAQPHDEHAGTA